MKKCTKIKETILEPITGGVMYSIIEDNDLWDLECLTLRELTYAIRSMMECYGVNITDDYFKSNPKEYYVDRFKLESFTVEYLLKLWEAIELLIEFKAALKVGWPWI